ncbi:PfkB family carbohydrate kinase [Thiorhodococcus mannitoliphagus]|uniref:PfkB family carbohydrate kinase n=1 Tax=Thiorhodococcus mannitoliphagus TaxID=329406 RepID=UPI001F11006C|nr:PfkB family carbohydrate kinase [Thiorhodococcus mannitoliphagus]
MLGIPDFPAAFRPSPACRVLGVGIATLDLINEVDCYPSEDSEVRALSQRRVRGGNVANSLSVLAQLGHQCTWLGTLADDAASQEVLLDLEHHGIDATAAVTVPGAMTPTSYVTLSRVSGSRTIVHHRDLPELDAAGFEALSLKGVQWVHFEGRNPAETASMIQSARRRAPQAVISLELEKPRPGIEALLAGPHLIIAGRAYAQARGFEDPGAFLRDLERQTTAGLCVLGWGAGGAYLRARGGCVEHAGAHAPAQVVDTLGAGDCLNAAVIDGLLRALTPREAVVRAVRLAGLKCGRIGLDGLVAEARRTGWF